MSMNHYFEFFDRAAADHLWNITWRTLIRRNPQIAWLQSTERVEVGSYDGKSLRQLLTFCIQQSPKRIEAILETRKVADTLRRCSGQFFAMSELMNNALDHSGKFIVSVEIRDVYPLISIAWKAFHSDRISSATLWSVFKLNSVKPTDLSDGSQAAPRWVKDLLPWHRLWDPIYSWQGKRFREDEWSNCLGLADTRRFISFVRRANKENWATASPNTRAKAASTLRFRDDPNCIRIFKCMQKVKQLKSPCVTRMWQ